MPKRDRMCGHKTKHPTREGAIVEARKALNVGIDVYRCKQCKRWHIGKTRSPTRSADRIGALLARHERKLNASAHADSPAGASPQNPQEAP
jgi:hypothetical protein